MHMLIKVVIPVVISVQMHGSIAQSLKLVRVSQQRFQNTSVRPTFRIIVIILHSVQHWKGNPQSTEQSKTATLMVRNSLDCFPDFISVISSGFHFLFLASWFLCGNPLSTPTCRSIWFWIARSQVLLIVCGCTWNRYCKVERSAQSLTLNNNSEMIHLLVSSAVSSLFALPSGTMVPAGSWSSGSIHVRYIRKTGGCCDFFSNRKVKIQTAPAPGFDVIQL